MRTLRLREPPQSDSGHPDSEWGSQDVTPSLIISHSQLVPNRAELGQMGGGEAWGGGGGPALIILGKKCKASQERELLDPGA